MPEILLYAIATALYAGLALHFWLTRWRGPVLDQPSKRPASWQRPLLLAATVLHGLTLVDAIFPGNGMRFGFAASLSLIMWLAIALHWIESFYARMDGLQMLGLPLAAACVMLPAIFPGQHIMANASSPAFRAHFLMAMFAYGLFTLAAMHSILMAFAERSLHRGRLSPLLAGLPPLLTMETLLFRLLHVAFLLLTLTLLSGILFSETLFGKALPFNHKTIFAVLSWLIFAALLTGRHLRGWRGRIALRWTLSGFGALLLAYVGSRFVLEVILGRS